MPNLQDINLPAIMAAILVAGVFLYLFLKCDKSDWSLGAEMLFMNLHDSGQDEYLTIDEIARRFPLGTRNRVERAIEHLLRAGRLQGRPRNGDTANFEYRIDPAHRKPTRVSTQQFN